MLHIVLLIFKIIGSILLVLLSLLLLIFLVVLLVPIRYRILAEHGDEIRVDGWVSWLLHLIHARFSYMEDKFQVQIRVFGFLIYDSLRPKAEKTRRMRSKKTVQRKKHNKTKSNTRGEGKKTGNIKTKPQPISPSDTMAEYSVRADAPIQAAEPLKLTTEPAKPQIETQTRQEFNQQEMGQKQLGQKQLGQKQLEQDNPRKKKAKKKRNFFLRNIFIKLKSFKDSLILFIKNSKKKLSEILEKAAGIKEKIDLVSDFIHNELNRKGLQITFSSLKKLLKHILPTKLKSKVIFGTGDPCTTGQVLGMLGVVYSLYGDKVQIIPDFENSRFEGKHDAKGRIRLVTILIIGIKLILDKRFKELKRNFILLKEAL